MSLVSVIIPCFNSSQTIIRALDSVRCQDYVNEILVVDDGSIDNTIQLVEEWSASNNPLDIKIYRFNSNKGASSARNFGMVNASSKYIAFLDSDDAWLNHKLKIQVELLDVHPDVFMSFHDSLNLSEEEVSSDKIDYEYFELRKLLFRNIVPTRSVMLRNQSKFYFDESMTHAEDFDLWGRIISKNKCIYIKSCLATSFEHPGHRGLSSNLKSMHRGVLYSLKKLRDSNLISNSSYVFFTSLERLKYFLRYVRKFFRTCGLS
ncbi:glycosyltransferase family 2 protein [Vibrio rotiferianus]|uniref:glycosyltransferase family 2 protein n=1 Tax=Vibrio rotiferianus TaxID=190895 RepID=UPI00390B400B